MSLGNKLRTAIEKLKNSSAIDKETVKEVVKELQRALISSDVEVTLVLNLSKKIEEQAFRDLPEGITRKEHIIKVTYDLLSELLGGEIKTPEKPSKILLVGLQGNGKTTTAGKLAKYYTKRGKKVFVVCADTFRPAAYEQLKQLTEQINVKFYGKKGEPNAQKIVNDALKQLEKDEILIVDSAGRSGLDEELTKEIKAINETLSPDQTWLVLGADVGQIAKKQAKAFEESVGINGIIITRTDGSAKGGGALAACHTTSSPVMFVGTGEKIDDLDSFDAKRYLGKVMGYGDLEGLLEKIKDIELNQDNIERMMEGEFNLEIFYEQLKATRSMGPMDKVLDMMGLKAQLPPEMVEMSEKKLDSFRYLMDSMTKKEKQDPDILNHSRIERIAKGAGKKVEEVRELIAQYKKMKKMFKKMNKLTSDKDLKDGNVEKILGKFGGMMKKKKKFKIR